MFPTYSRDPRVAAQEPNPVLQSSSVLTSSLKKPKIDSIAYPLSYSHDIEPEHFRGYELLITLAAGIIVAISLWPMFSKAASPDVPEFCANGFEKTQYSGKFVWKTGKPLKIRIGNIPSGTPSSTSTTSTKMHSENPSSTQVAHIFDRTGKCFAVCKPAPTSQNMKNPSIDGGFDFQCAVSPSMPEFKEFASHAVIAPHPEHAPAIFRTPLIRFGTYINGYSEAILQSDVRTSDEPILAGN